MHEMDTIQNQERERRRKQEIQDFWLKKEFMKNAFNQEASQTVNQMVASQKLVTNNIELRAVNETRIT